MPAREDAPVGEGGYAAVSSLPSHALRTAVGIIQNQDSTTTANIENRHNDIGSVPDFLARDSHVIQIVPRLPARADAGAGLIMARILLCVATEVACRPYALRI